VGFVPPNFPISNSAAVSILVHKYICVDFWLFS
jgi:hypothetical protein